jgi:hypothetical protein
VKAAQISAAHDNERSFSTAHLPATTQLSAIAAAAANAGLVLGRNRRDAAAPVGQAADACDVFDLM